MILTGNLTIPFPTALSTPFEIALKSEGNEERIRFVVEIQNSFPDQYAIRCRILARSPLGNKLLAQRDMLLDAAPGQDVDFQIMRDMGRVSMQLLDNSIDVNLMFPELAQTSQLVVRGSMAWGVDSQDCLVKTIAPELTLSAMEKADRTYARKDFRTAADLYRNIEKSSNTKTQQDEAQLKKSLALYQLARQSSITNQELHEVYMPEIPEGVRGRPATEQIATVWDSMGRTRSNPYATYAVFMLLRDQLLEHGLDWDSADIVSMAAQWEQLKLLLSDNKPLFVPVDLWDRVQMAAHGSAGNQIEQLKLDAQGVEVYRLLLEFCSQAPVVMAADLKYGAARACVYIGDADQALTYLTELIADPVMWPNRLMLTILEEYLWAANLWQPAAGSRELDDNENRLALATIEQFESKATWIPDYHFAIMKSQTLLNLGELQEAGRILDSLLQSEPPEDQGADPSFYLSLCRAFLLRGYVFHVEEQTEQAQEMWNQGYRSGIENGVNESDIFVVMLGSLSRQIDKEFAERSFKRNLAEGGFPAGGMLLSLISQQMQDISLAMRDMYSTAPGIDQYPRLLLHQVDRKDFLLIQAEMGMLHVIRRGAFYNEGQPVNEDPAVDLLIRGMSRSGLEAFCAKELFVSDMLEILFAWLNPAAADPSKLHESVRDELAYIIAHRIINAQPTGPVDKVQALLEFAGKSESAETRRLARASLDGLVVSEGIR